MPKDEPSDGIGHRYDWECAVVWIDDPTAAAPTVVGLSASAHGDFNSKKSDFSDNFDGTRALIEYVSYWPLDHQMAITTTVGGSQPMIAWESMTNAARCSLTNFDFGSADVAFIESAFVSNLDKAWNAGDDNI